MTKWVDAKSLNDSQRARIKFGAPFLPTFTLNKQTGLPEIAISEAVFDELTGEYLGRDYLDAYPRGFSIVGESVRGPALALKYAEMYYEEGLYYDQPEFLKPRIECFKAAEVLYYHAAVCTPWQGSAEAWRELGRLYYYDRCHGDYWLIDESREILESYPDVFLIKDRGQRAYYCLKKAIELGDVEARYILGDVFSEGIGCTVDVNKAANYYLDAYSHSQECEPFVIGSSALRVARSYEFGEGFEQSFDEAFKFYEIAFTHLKRAVDSGEDTYEEECVWAEKGYHRTLQEVAAPGTPFGYQYSNRPRRYCD